MMVWIYQFLYSPPLSGNALTLTFTFFEAIFFTVLIPIPTHLDKLLSVKPYLLPPSLLTNLHLHLQSSRPQQGLIYQVRPVGHTWGRDRWWTDSGKKRKRMNERDEIECRCSGLWSFSKFGWLSLVYVYVFAPMTRMLLSCSTPSILDSSWLTTVSWTPVLPAMLPRCLQIASISSNMMMWRPLLAPSWSAERGGEKINDSNY